MRPFRKTLAQYFRHLEGKTKWAFLWWTWLHAVVIAYAVGHLVHLIFPARPRADLVNMDALQLCMLVLAVGPFVETMVFQFLPLEFSRAAGARRWIRFAVSIIPFALAHQAGGVPAIAAAGCIGGFFFAFTYERWRTESVIVAVVMTLLLHSSFNLVAVVATLLTR